MRYYSWQGLFRYAYIFICSIGGLQIKGPVWLKMIADRQMDSGWRKQAIKIHTREITHMLGIIEETKIVHIKFYLLDIFKGKP